jgi:hypothetical protein
MCPRVRWRVWRSILLKKEKRTLWLGKRQQEEKEKREIGSKSNIHGLSNLCQLYNIKKLHRMGIYI